MFLICRLTLLGAVTAILLAVSCTDEPGAPAQPQVAPIAAVSIWLSDPYRDPVTDSVVDGIQLDVYVSVLADPIPVIQQVLVNGLQPDSSSMYMGSFVAIVYDPDTTGGITVTVVTSQGTCSGTLRVPRPAVIVSHADGDTVEPNVAVPVSWQGDADAYWFSAWISDTSDSYDWVDTFLVGTTYTLSAEHLAEASHIELDVSCMNGYIGTPGQQSKHDRRHAGVHVDIRFLLVS